MKIAITDSGFGGLSIAAELFEILRKAKLSTPLEIIYINGLPNEKYGFNSLRKTKDKVQLFNNLLYSIRDRVNPDIFVIACNTLSVLLKSTDIYQEIQHKTIDIIEFGTESVVRNHHPKAEALLTIIGTQTTIESGVHRRFFENQPDLFRDILSIPATELVSTIEKVATGKASLVLIHKYIDQIKAYISKSNGFGELYLLLACTHFQYALPIFSEQLQAVNIPVSIINPNKNMIEHLKKIIFNSERDTAAPERDQVDFRIISQTIVTHEHQETIGQLIRQISPESISVIHRYEHIPDFYHTGNYFK